MEPFTNLSTRTASYKLLNDRATKIWWISTWTSFNSLQFFWIKNPLVVLLHVHGPMTKLGQISYAKPTISSIITKSNYHKIWKTKGILVSNYNISGVDLADIHLVSKYNKGFFFWLCFSDIYSKYASVVSLKDKKGYYNY